MATPTMVIAGCTATGKSAVAQAIAERTGAAIVSADSMLVYRGMDVGTAKPTREERSRVRYIGLDCVGPGERFSTGAWLECVREGLASLPPGTPVIVAGGTGLYIRALMEGLDAPPPNEAARNAARAIFERGGLAALQAEVARLGAPLPPGDAANPRRLIRAIEKALATEGGERGPALLQLPVSRVFLLSIDRAALNERIEARARAMFEGGIVEEATRIFGEGAPSETAAGAIGYAEALAFARGELAREEAIARVAARTRQLAKRQRTWFRHQLAATAIAVAPGDGAGEVAARILHMAPFPPAAPAQAQHMAPPPPAP